MKIGIVTLPFNSNYGGILQAYAMQSVLKKMGHKVLTVNRTSKGESWMFKTLSFGKRLVQRYCFGKKVVVRTWPTKKEATLIAQHTRKFIDEHIELTNCLNSEKDFKTLQEQNFDAWVVGSDQVWRPKYSPDIANHYLGFLPKNEGSKKISYAASFGVDSWEYSNKETAACKKLIEQFDAVGVRELSGIDLCQKYFNIKADQFLDPTMLVEKEEYIQLVENDNLPVHDKKLLTYILDRNPRVLKMVEMVEKQLELEAFSTMPKNFFRNVGSKELDQCICPKVTDWIKGFMDAEFVITDSFHGTVFCIIFNKPFFALGNKKRGMSRFTTLLKIFGLEDRLITEIDDSIELKLQEKIDFDRVNKILDAEKKRSIDYLRSSLNS